MRAGWKREVWTAIWTCMPRPIGVTLLYQLLGAAGNWLLLMGMLKLLGRDVLQKLVMPYGDMDAAWQNWMSFWAENGGRVLWILGLWFLAFSIWAALCGGCYRGYCLALERGENPGVRVLLAGLRYWPALLAAQVLVLLRWLLLYAAVLMAALGSIVLSIWWERAAEILLIGSMGLFMAGCLWLVLRYAFVQYLILDHPDMRANQALRASVSLLRGYRKTLLWLYLSFTGWILLIELVSRWIATGNSGGVAALLLAQMTQGKPVISGAVWMVLMPMLFSYLVRMVGYLVLSPYLVGCEARLYDWIGSQRCGAMSAGNTPAGSGPDRPKYE